MPALPTLTAQASIYPTSRYSYRAVPVAAYATPVASPGAVQAATPISPRPCYIVCGPCEDCTKTCETICGSTSTTHTESCCAAGPPNSSQTCVGGVCGWECDAGYLTCGDACCAPGYGCCTVNGVSTCVNISNNASNCGSCGNACPAGYGCCIVDGDWTCVNLTDSNANCGSCGIACSGGTTCQNGTCACPAGQTSCNGACVNLSTDDDNCGGCGHGCNGGTCENGSCTNCPVPPGYAPYSCPAGSFCCESVMSCCLQGDICGPIGCEAG